MKATRGVTSLQAKGLRPMNRPVYLCVEVAGCPTICQHCWAQGAPYPAMPLADITYVLEQASAACAAVGHPFTAFPMHEVAAHPQAPEVLRLFARYPGDPLFGEGGPMFEPLSTTGVPLALRADWEEVLAVCRELGTTVIWPAVHGRGETHDRMVHRAGAYQETLLGIDRMRAADMEVGCNVFLTRENVTEFDTLVADLLAHSVTQFAIEVATYLPTARSRRYEALRPTLADLSPLVALVQALPGPFFHCAEWLNLAAYTEAAHVRRALDGTWPAPMAPAWTELTLVCRPNLDLHWGTAGRYGRRYGNLRRDDAQEALRAALADGGGHEDALWFKLYPIPDVRSLAEWYGDPVGDRVHLWAESARRLWLDRAQRPQRPQHR
jgi:hypothetical protein